MNLLGSGFDYQARTRLVFGENALERVGELARGLPAQRVLVVTDKGIVQAGHVQRVCTLLEAAGVAPTVFDAVHENPTTDDVNACLEVARACHIEAFIGLGGGSSLDTAKGCNFLLTNGGEMRDYWGVGKAQKPMLPLIAIPTTAGTGSECQSFALIADAQTHQKMACGDTKAAPRIALLDPTLTLSQPPTVSACTGVDAITHAVETAVTNRRNPFSVLYSREAFRLTIQNLPRVLETPNDLKARGAMLLGAAFSGMAIEASMLGAAHSMANPLTAHFDVIHGNAVGLALPSVVRFNAELSEVAEGYRDLAVYAGLVGSDASAEEAIWGLVEVLKTVFAQAGVPRTLGECGAQEADIPRLAEEAAKQWTATFNPRTPSVEDFAALYRSLF